MSRRRALLVLAALAASIGAAAVPSTSGAFQAGITNSSDTAAAADRFSCSAAFAGATLRQHAYFEYSFGGTGASEPDLGPAGNTGTYTSHHSTVAVGDSDACPLDAGSAPYAWRTDGTSDWLSTLNRTSVPADFTLVVAFRTPALADSSKTQYLLGYNGDQSGLSGGQKDRHLYVDKNGYLQFGVYNGGIRMANTTGNTYDGNNPVSSNSVKVTDGRWHQAVGVSRAGSGLTLWLDGVKMATTDRTSSDQYSGYWRLAAGPLSGWPNTSGDSSANYYNGDLRFAAAFDTALDATQVAALWRDAAPGS